MANKRVKNDSKIISHTLETVKGIGDEINKSVRQDVVEGMGKDFIQQLLGIGLGFDSTSYQPQEQAQETVKDENGAIEVFSAAKHTPKEDAEKQQAAKKQNEKSQVSVEAAMNYHADVKKGSEKASRKEMGEMNQNLKEIKIELQKLIQSSRELQAEFAVVAVEQAPEDVGKYHINFFEWMLSVVRLARQKVEDSGAWLSTMKGKGKGKKGQVDHSKTNVNLSNERQVATQSG